MSSSTPSLASVAGIPAPLRPTPTRLGVHQRRRRRRPGPRPSRSARLLGWFEHQPHWVPVGATLLLLALVAVGDYATGVEKSVLVFYLLPVSCAAWFVGPAFGTLAAGLAAALSLWADLAAGARYSTPLVPGWNAAATLTSFLVVTWLLTQLRVALEALETRVDQRTAALNREIAERERLERELLAVSEREQRRIGHELHDSLCQHLTATALAGEVLSERLAARALAPEADCARRVVDYVEEAIGLARGLARGLFPVQLEADGLGAALRELAAKTTERHGVRCVYRDEAAGGLDPDPATAVHLYRIAQEAVTNAVRHGAPRLVTVTLASRPQEVVLSVQDDGRGLPAELPPARRDQGMGIRIMTHRAAIIGASFSVRATRPARGGGTSVSCRWRRLVPVTAAGPAFPVPAPAVGAPAPATACSHLE